MDLGRRGAPAALTRYPRGVSRTGSSPARRAVSRGVVAAGHPVSAQAGARVLRMGGNAVDAAVGAMLASFVAEPLLTSLGAGGYLLVAGPDTEPVLLDFFVEAPGRGADPAGRADLVPVVVDFGGALQVFHIGASSCGAYGTPHGAAEAIRRFGSMPLEELTGHAAGLARTGVEVNAQQAFVFEILAPIVASGVECRRTFMPDDRPLRAGETYRLPELAEALDRLGADGPEPFYTGDIAAAICDWVGERGGLLTRSDLAAYETIAREPLAVRYRGCRLLTNPPPNAGGPLLAIAMAQLDRLDGPPEPLELVRAMETAQATRTPAFLDGLADPGFADAFLAARLGSTTHVSVLDADGLGCSVTCSNGEGSAIVVPQTGVHVNNMMGEEDLSPLGFHSYPPGRRLPSMMSPTMLLRDGRPELVLGSAGSNRIRSALLQVIVNVLDHGMEAEAAVRAPRLHFEAGVVYAEPGIDLAAIEAAGHEVVRFGELNLFFGGANVVERAPRSGALLGAGDPRRGGAAVCA
jgi:gamma-glutamyltranspeptidase/glutathione hydrolase